MPLLVSLALVVVSTTSQGVEAKAAKKYVEAKVITYSELMSLPPYKRQEYLSGLRKILVEFERGLSAQEVAFLDAEPRGHRRWQALFAALAPSAAAAAVATQEPARCKKGEVLETIGNAQTCVLIRKKSEGCPSGTSPIVGSRGDTLKCFKEVPIVIAPSSGGGPSPSAGGGVAGQPGAPDQKGGSSPGRDGQPGLSDNTAPSAPAVPPPKGCEPLVPQCNPNREESRQAFYGKKRPCLFAGNPSTYPEAKPEKGKCVAVAQFKNKQLGVEPAHCPKGQVMCNPMVFGVRVEGEKKSLFCVPVGAEATQDCDKIAPPFTGLEFQGAIEEWNGFRDELKTICSQDEASTQFHCKECGVLYRRLFALEAKFRPNLCDSEAQPPGSGSGDQESGTSK